jgi:hypothetical protein
VDYEVTGPGLNRVTAQEHRTVEPYDSKLHNYKTEEEYIAAHPTGLLLFHGSGIPAPTQELMDAFNAWRMSEHESSLAELRARPDKYGEESTWTHMAPAPTRLRGAHFHVVWNVPGPDCWKHGHASAEWIIDTE